MSADNKLISFDELNRVRILDVDSSKASAELLEESEAFNSKLGSFSTTVQGLLELLQTETSKIDEMKLLAIAQRNRLEAETELRKLKQQELNYKILQKQQSAQREKENYGSLLKVEQEQKAIIEKLQRQA
jgi:hypothetical protein